MRAAASEELPRTPSIGSLSSSFAGGRGERRRSPEVLGPLGPCELLDLTLVPVILVPFCATTVLPWDLDLPSRFGCPDSSEPELVTSTTSSTCPGSFSRQPLLSLLALAPGATVGIVFVNSQIRRMESKVKQRVSHHFALSF